MPDNLEAGWHVFQHLTLVLPDAAEQAATASRAGAGRLVCDGLAWQMRRQRGSGRVAALPRLYRRVGAGLGVLIGRGTRLRLGSVFLEVADQQFELFNLAVELLRRGPRS
jgi:hypothetical protein